MQRIAWLGLLALLAWGTPAFAGPASDVDGDGVPDNLDNCSLKANPAQDDTDGDYCGNICDCDYNQNGAVTIADFGQFAVVFGTTGHALQQHVEPISADNAVNIVDFGSCFVGRFDQPGPEPPGPSGTTPGTTACP